MPTGVLIVDKARGPTSFDVVAEVRRRLGERRVGHTGTLDPLATGVLPICLGEATKLVPFLVDGHKRYVAEVRFGIATDTLDAAGQVTATADATHLTEASVVAALPSFVGKLLQIPPAHSALRHNGERAYEAARRGETLILPPREVEVYCITLDAWLEGPAARLTIDCGKGTYVRSIARDLGRAVGLPAHLQQLRRTLVSPFGIDEAVPIETLGPDTPLMGLADALRHLPRLRLDEEESKAVRDGKSHRVADLATPQEALRVALLRPDGALLAVAARPSPHGILRLERVFG